MENEKVVLNFDEFSKALGGDVSTEEVEPVEVQMVETEAGNIIAVDEEELKKENERSTNDYADLEEFYKEIGINGDETLDLDSIAITNDLIAKACKDLFRLDEASTNKIIKVVKEYRPLSEEEKEKYSAYMKLPDKLKQMINAASPDKIGRNMVARELLDEVIQAACIDSEFNKVKDMMGSLAKDMDIKNTTKMYTEYQLGLFETNLEQHRENIKDKDPEKAEVIGKIIKAFKNSYTFENLIEAYKTNGGKYRPKKIELEKFESRILDQFNQKYINSKFDIPNIFQAYYMLDKKLPKEYSIDDIKRFFVLFYKYTKTFSPNNVEEHTFMYYTVMNIITLNFADMYEKEEENTFLNKVLDGIVNAINTIKECDEKHKK